jgi:hypothetical protein
MEGKIIAGLANTIQAAGLLLFTGKEHGKNLRAFCPFPVAF